MQAIYGEPAELVKGDQAVPILSPTKLLDTILGFGRKGIAIQRYKGLGEMNPSSFGKRRWTPMPARCSRSRWSMSIPRTRCSRALMGDVVEPRRDFIQANALKVANLDI